MATKTDYQTIVETLKELDDSAAFLEQGRSRSSIDRAYYAIYYGAVALLSRHGIEPPRSHRGLVNLFGRELVTRGVVERELSGILGAALRDRITSTYSVDAEVTRENA